MGPPLGVHVLDIGQKSAVWAGMSAMPSISSALPPAPDLQDGGADGPYLTQKRPSGASCPRIREPNSRARLVVQNGYTELIERPFSRGARHDSEGLSQAYEDRVVPFELGAVQVLEDRNDRFDREPGALENT